MRRAGMRRLQSTTSLSPTPCQQRRLRTFRAASPRSTSTMRDSASWRRPLRVPQTSTRQEGASWRRPPWPIHPVNRGGCSRSRQLLHGQRVLGGTAPPGDGCVGFSTLGASAFLGDGISFFNSSWGECNFQDVCRAHSG